MAAISVGPCEEGSAGTDLYWQAANGSGVAEALLTRTFTQSVPACSPDGKRIAYIEVHPVTGIWVLPVGGDPEPFVATPFSERAARFSSDGKWIAYVSDESGRDEVYVQGYPEGGHLVSNDGGTEPEWPSSGGELFYQDRLEETNTYEMVRQFPASRRRDGSPRAEETASVTPLDYID